MNVVLVGDFAKGKAEDFIASFYDPRRTSEYVAQWIGLKHQLEDEETDAVVASKRPRKADLTSYLFIKKELEEEEAEPPFIEPETIISEMDVKQEHMDKWTKGSDPIGSRKYYSWSKLPESDMSLEKVQCLVMTSQIQGYKGSLQLREGEDHEMFHSVDFKGGPIPYVSCKECQKVFDARPTEALDAHVEAEHPNALIKPNLLETLIRWRMEECEFVILKITC